MPSTPARYSAFRGFCFDPNDAMKTTEATSPDRKLLGKKNTFLIHYINNENHWMCRPYTTIPGGKNAYGIPDAKNVLDEATLGSHSMKA